jgi:hypothetical protein
MSRFLKFVHREILNERGISLVELLVAVGIFLAIILPLSSIYISGISLYDRIRIETELQNETDFILSGILNKIQDASYFELPEESFDPTTHSTLTDIFTSPLAGENILPATEKTNVMDGLITYNLQLSLNDDDNDPVTPPVQKSSLKRSFYQFNMEEDAKHEKQEEERESDSPNNNFEYFEYNEGAYVVGGLFNITKNNQSLIVYLVAAPRGSGGAMRNGQKSQFTNLEDIAYELNRLKVERDKNPSQKNEPLHFIRIIKTEFAVNNLKKG